MAGGEGFASAYQTLFETWNGSAWSIVPSPNASPGDGTDPATVANRVLGIDCSSVTSCSAVGYSSPPAGSATESLAWDGSAWALAPTPTPNETGASDTQLDGVSCVTDWQCVAVGVGIAGPSNPFIISAPIARSGYRFVASDGGVFAYGSGAPFLGSTGGMTLNNPIVGMALTTDGAGYWLVASDGGIFSYGDARFFGSAGALPLNNPIVGMAATPNGSGYYLVASDGGIFTYGDATFAGSTGGTPLNRPIVGIAAPLTGGYYLVASDGGIFTFPTTGGPPFYGSTGSIALNKPIVGMTAVAGGYYLSGSDGGVFTFPTSGGPPFLGSTGSIALNKPIVGISA
jgi:hypothetical protein